MGSSVGKSNNKDKLSLESSKNFDSRLLSDILVPQIQLILFGVACDSIATLYAISAPDGQNGARCLSNHAMC
jgi:hypothetical protein